MTPYMAREYLTKIGSGDWDAGMDLALAELDSEGFQFRPGMMPLAPDGRPTCCVLWRLGFEVQVASCHGNTELRRLLARQLAG